MPTKELLCQLFCRGGEGPTGTAVLDTYRVRVAGRGGEDITELAWVREFAPFFLSLPHQPPFSQSRSDLCLVGCGTVTAAVPVLRQAWHERVKKRERI